MTWALYYHPESDSLFWSDEWPNDGLCEDVTYEAKFQDAAATRGLKCPGKIRERNEYELTVEVTSKSHTLADAMVKSYRKWKRKPADLYPTPVDAVESLIPVLKAMKRPDGTPIKRIWEPACGDGRIARVLEYHGFEVISTDIRELPGYGYGGLDFLNDDPEAKWGWDMGEIDLILTNPPFSLAEEFIRHALSICPNVVMLLKQTYWNTKGRSVGEKSLWNEHTPAMELKLTWRLAFLKTERGNSPIMDCMWVIWTKPDDMLVNSSGRTICIVEPLDKRNYPGYDGIGIKSGMEVLEGEIDALATTLKGLQK